MDNQQTEPQKLVSSKMGAWLLRWQEQLMMAVAMKVENTVKALVQQRMKARMQK